jgi:hypothetical protein
MKIENQPTDVFEAARQAFFAGNDGAAPKLNSAHYFTQVKSLDNPLAQGCAAKTSSDNSKALLVCG